MGGGLGRKEGGKVKRVRGWRKCGRWGRMVDGGKGNKEQLGKRGKRKEKGGRKQGDKGVKREERRG